jgi:bifunctional non-homologous end joining protein LigD
MARRRIGRRTLETTNEDKVLFPDCGVTKGELIEHYERVAELMLPHLRERPLVLQRFPDGIGRKGFYQRSAGKHFPSWIRTVRLPKVGGSVRHVVCDDAATLVYLADQACVALHALLARADRPDRPDRLVLDLDPSTEDFAPVVRAARDARALLEELGLVPFLLATGSRGLHVVCPLERSSDFEAVRAFASDVAGLLERQRPEERTRRQRKHERGRRLYLDVARNSYAQSTVAPWSVRARPGAPVAVPLDWDELGRSGLRSDRWRLRGLGRRLAAVEDPWRGIGRRARSLAGPRRRLDALLEER